MRNLANETQKSKEAGTEDCRNHPIDRRQSDSYDAVPPGIPLRTGAVERLQMYRAIALVLGITGAIIFARSFKTK